MVQVKKYYLPPTALVPNSPRPLLHYTKLELPTGTGERASTSFYDLFEHNGWETRWIYRYGPTQRSHYHSGVHECMAVLSGTATIRFGVADVPDDTGGSAAAREQGGVEVEARAGDVFVLPAGTAHKTYDAKPVAGFELLTPGDGHGVAAAAAADVRAALAGVELSGFTMLGAYPKGSGSWDFMLGGKNAAAYEEVWAVEMPKRDPVLGESEDGICGLWT